MKPFKIFAGFALAVFVSAFVYVLNTTKSEAQSGGFPSMPSFSAVNNTGSAVFSCGGSNTPLCVASAPSTDYDAVFIGNSTSGSSYGLFVEAGTTGSDLNLALNNQSGSLNLLTVHGDGGVLIPNTITGGDEGYSTVNAGAYYQAGVKLPSAAWGVFGGVGSCAISASYQSSGLSSCTRNSAGNYTVTLSRTYATSQPACTFTSVGTQADIATQVIVGGNTTSVQVENCIYTAFNTCTASDAANISMTCMGT